MARLRHYLKPHLIQPLLVEGVIRVEGRKGIDYEAEDKLLSEFYGVYEKRSSAEIRKSEANDKHYSKYIGDYVWLTEEKYCATAQSTNAPKDNELYLEFDSEEIGATKWHYLKKTFTNEVSVGLAKGLDKSAKEMGDNPYCYWICKNPVSIAFAKVKGILAMSALAEFFESAKKVRLRQLELKTAFELVAANDVVFEVKQAMKEAA